MPIDNLFDEENKDLLAQMEAQSAAILNQLSSANLGKSSLDNLRANSTIAYRSPFLDRAGIIPGTNIINTNRVSTFSYNGQDQQGNNTYSLCLNGIACDDGAKVYSTYSGSPLNAGDLTLFYEKEATGKSNLFGSLYIAAIGDDFETTIKSLLLVYSDHEASGYYLNPGNTGSSGYGSWTSEVRSFTETIKGVAASNNTIVVYSDHEASGYYLNPGNTGSSGYGSWTSEVKSFTETIKGAISSSNTIVVYSDHEASGYYINPGSTNSSGYGSWTSETVNFTGSVKGGIGTY